MGYFNRDSNNRSGRDNRGGGRGFGGRRGGFGRSDDRPREMFKTVCSNCGKECEVPFKPTSGKPVYCSDCFEKMGNRGADSSKPERRDKPSFDRHQTPVPRVDYGQQFESLSKKMDRIIELLTPKVEMKKENAVVEEVKAVDDKPKTKKLVKSKKLLQKKK